MLDYPIKALKKQDVNHLEFVLQCKINDIFGWEYPERDKAMEAGYVKGMTRILAELGYEVKITSTIVRDKYHREEVDKKK